MTPQEEITQLKNELRIADDKAVSLQKRCEQLDATVNQYAEILLAHGLHPDKTINKSV